MGVGMTDEQKPEVYEPEVLEAEVVDDEGANYWWHREGGPGSRAADGTEVPGGVGLRGSFVFRAGDPALRARVHANMAKARRFLWLSALTFLLSNTLVGHAVRMTAGDVSFVDILHPLNLLFGFATGLGLLIGTAIFFAICLGTMGTRLGFLVFVVVLSWQVFGVLQSLGVL
jgi:hypothetical protein